MRSCIFDLETDNLLQDVTVVHCGVIIDIDTTEVFEYQPGEHQALMERLLQYDMVCGHNIIGYDLPVLNKLYGFQLDPSTTVRDTLVWSRLVWPDISFLDNILIAKSALQFPNPKMVGSHSLAAMGHRLGFLKGTFGGSVESFSRFSQEMLDYCRQDVMVTLKLYHKCHSHQTSDQAIELEHEFAQYLQDQMTCGVEFDVAGAVSFVETLQRKADWWHTKIVSKIPSVIEEKSFTPARDNKTLGYIKGKTIIKSKVVAFNPASSKHIVRFFIDKYGWVPTVFTKPTKANRQNPDYKPNPTVSYEVLSKLPYPEAPGLARYRVLMDRIGLISSEANSWLKCVTPQGRIHGQIIHNGTPTGRCRHYKPNLGNIPSVEAKYGKQCRQFFKARAGFTLVGCDFDGLELRALAHALYPFDGGAFFKRAFMGNKEDKTDVHSLNCRDMQATLDGGGIWAIKEGDTKKSPRIVLSRNDAKTAIYAFIYGAGNFKMGQTFIGDGYPERYTMSVGKLVKEALYLGMPGLKKLEGLLKVDVEGQKNQGSIPHIEGLDGRMIPVRACFAVLNTELQSIGAILCKQASVLIRKALLSKGWMTEVFPVLHVHDELQLETVTPRVDEIKALLERCFAQSGEMLSVRVPIKGTSASGTTWAATH